jgi:hypothetical protein
MNDARACTTQLPAATGEPARRFDRLAARPPAAAPKTVPLVLLISALACLPASADCRYGDSSKPERAEIHPLNDGVYMCLDGAWIRNNDIIAVLRIEKASLWTEALGAADETEYVRSACGERQSCALPPTAAWTGRDLDPTRRKQLWVRYHCGLGPKDLPTSHVATQATEDAPLLLSCRTFTHR